MIQEDSIITREAHSTAQVALSRCPKKRVKSREPLPTCNSFMITEIGYLHAVASTHDQDRHNATWELGMMANRGQRSAIGGSLYATTAHGGAFGLKARYRHWMNNSTSIDFSPGILLKNGRGKIPAFTGHVGMSFGDQIAIVSQWDAVSYRGHRDGILRTSQTEFFWSAGVKLGSKPALYGAAVEALVTVVGIVVFLATYEGS